MRSFGQKNRRRIEKMDLLKEDMQIVGVTEQDARCRMIWTQMICSMEKPKEVKDHHICY